MNTKRPPARWRWTSKKKDLRELWRGFDRLASVSHELREDSGPLPSWVWVWRVDGTDRWGMSKHLGDCEREAKEVAKGAGIAAAVHG